MNVSIALMMSFVMANPCIICAKLFNYIGDCNSSISAAWPWLAGARHMLPSRECFMNFSLPLIRMRRDMIIDLKGSWQREAKT